ncbi:DUF58 domain-containing protein [Enterococcus sp. 669A]|uniref:DUF58 domain-containing protein n=1 Tax=Candidatus Enterococcus moelleringii TaxID=2815325 RepID=A0ABS3LA41_9ENTE|nr:DUF58 domain-containing protein [Enterococcus sp. 669A]MBO1305611.1 DUF58 domain-containing protein [Enterococcus sp. 669A]
MWLGIFRRLVLAFIYLAAFFYSAVFNNDIGWTLFIFMSLVLLFSLVQLAIPLGSITAESADTVVAHLNKEATLPIVLRREQALLPLAQLTISVVDPLVETSETTYLFWREEQHDFIWQPTQRGLYQSMTLRYQSSDFFQLFTKSRKVEIAKEMLVLPQLQPARNILRLQETMKNQAFGEPTFAVKNYRPYRSGDAPKNIDWKLSSKQSTLIYRELETEQLAQTVWLFISTPSEHFEAMLSYYYSLQTVAQEPMEQYLFGDQLDDPAKIDALAFAQIQPLTTVPVLPDFKDKSIFLFTPEQTPETAEVRARLSKDNQVTVYDYDTLAGWFRETKGSR